MSIGIMMRNIATGLAAATIAMGGSTLSASALYGQENSMSGLGHRFAELTSMQRKQLRGIVRQHFADLTPMQRERIREFVRQRFAELTPRSMQRERLRAIVRERFADLSPMQHERISRFVRARYEQLTPLEREHLHRRGPYGRR
jgi:hypothetical protein